MASIRCPLFFPEDIKGKIRRVLALSTSAVHQNNYQEDVIHIPEAVLPNIASEEKCPLGTTKLTIFKASGSSKYFVRTLEYVFCKLRLFNFATDREILGYYLSVYELAAPGTMSDGMALALLRGLNYEVAYHEVNSEQKLKELPKTIGLDLGAFENWHRRKSLNQKVLLLGVCLYTLLLGSGVRSFNSVDWLKNHISLLSDELGLPFEAKLWMNRFAFVQTCELIDKSIDFQPIRAHCFRAIQQMAKLESQGRKGFEAVLRFLRWTEVEDVEHIFTHLLDDPYFELLTKSPLDRHLSKLQTAFRFLARLPISDVPYVFLIKEDDECMEFGHENLMPFLLAVKAIASLTDPHPENYASYLATTPYLEYLEKTVREKIIPADMNSSASSWSSSE